MKGFYHVLLYKVISCSHKNLKAHTVCYFFSCSAKESRTLFYIKTCVKKRLCIHRSAMLFKPTEHKFNQTELTYHKHVKYIQKAYSFSKPDL